MLGSDIELMPGEKMILASNPHWFYFWKQVLAAAAMGTRASRCAHQRPSEARKKAPSGTVTGKYRRAAKG